MKKFIHIGFPKNFSTTLQRNFFSKHPNIAYLGIGIDSNLGYVDDEIEIATELYLKYAKDYKYAEREGEIIKAFKKHFDQFEKNDKFQCLGLSSEHFSFPFTNDVIDTNQIAHRLKKIFKNDTKIIMILRNQVDIIRSLYRESIRVGYFGTFQDFTYYLYKFQERNYLYNFLYNNVFNTYSELFGADNIYVLFFENYRDDETKKLKASPDGKILLVRDVCEALSVPYIDIDIQNHNEALPSNVLFEKEKLNKQFPHDLGNRLYDGAENHRISKYYLKHLDLLNEESYFYKDVITKRRLINEAQNKAVEETNMDLSFSNPIGEKLVNMFSKSNKTLEKKLGFKLPSEYA